MNKLSNIKYNNTMIKFTVMITQKIAPYANMLLSIVNKSEGTSTKKSFFLLPHHCL